MAVLISSVALEVYFALAGIIYFSLRYYYAGMIVPLGVRYQVVGLDISIITWSLSQAFTMGWGESNLNCRRYSKRVRLLDSLN